MKFLKGMSIFVLIVLLAAILLAVLPTIARAQDATPEATDVVITLPTLEPTPVVDVTPEPPIIVDEPPAPVAPVFEAPALQDVVRAAIAALVAIFAAAISSPLTAPLVSLIKRIQIPFIQSLGGNEINLLVALGLSGILWVGQVFGYGSQVDTGFKIVYALLPFLAGTGSNFLSNQALYAVGVKQDIPVLGYMRSGVRFNKSKSTWLKPQNSSPPEPVELSHN